MLDTENSLSPSPTQPSPTFLGPFSLSEFSWQYNTSYSILNVVRTQYKFGVWMLDWKISSGLITLNGFGMPAILLFFFFVWGPSCLSFFPAMLTLEEEEHFGPLGLAGSIRVILHEREKGPDAEL